MTTFPDLALNFFSTWLKAASTYQLSDLVQTYFPGEF